MTNLNAEFFTQGELSELPFKSLGSDVLIHRRAVMVNIEAISIGDNSRLDADCTLLASGPISIGRHVHIGRGSYLAGRGGITLCDFSGMSQNVCLYSASDDYSGRHMTNPTIPEEYLGLTILPITLGRHAAIGSGAVLLPGASMGEGAAVGALSLLRSPAEPWGIYVGTPARRVAERRRDVLMHEANLYCSRLRLAS